MHAIHPAEILMSNEKLLGNFWFVFRSQNGEAVAQLPDSEPSDDTVEHFTSGW